MPPVRNAIILVSRTGTIEAAGPPDLVAVPKGAREVRLDGKWIVPGLIDAHVHAERWAMPRFLAYGVTAVRDLGGAQDSLIFLRNDIDAGQVAGPRLYISGAPIDGPGSPSPHATVVRTANDARRAVGSRVLISVSQIAVLPRLDRAQLTALLDDARALETPVAAQFGRVDALTGVRMGVASLEYLSGIPEATMRNPTALQTAWSRNGLAAWGRWETAWGPLDSVSLDRVARVLVQAGTAVVPTLATHESLVRLGDAAFRDSLDLSGIPESVGAGWESSVLRTRYGLSAGVFAAGRRSRAAQDLFVRRVAAAGGRLAAGSGSGMPLVAPGAGLHRELALLVAAGLEPERALLAATRDAARLLEADSIGVVRTGGVADFLVLDGDPFADIHNTRRIDRIVVGGSVWTPAELRGHW